MSEVYRLVLLLTAAAAAVALVTSLRDIRARWALSTTFVFGIAWVLNLDHVVAAFTNQYRVHYDPITRIYTVIDGPIGQQVRRWALLLIIACGAALLIRSLTAQHSRPWNRSGLAAFLMLTSVLLSTWWNALAIDWRSVAPMLLLLAVATVLPAGDAARLGAALYGVTLPVVSALLLLYREPAAVRACGAKCSVFGVLYTGVVENENSLGISLALSFPFVLIALKGRLRTFGAIAMIAAVVGSESRSSQFAIAATLAVFVLSRATRRTRMIQIAAVGMTVFALVFVLVESRGDSLRFTNRAGLWDLAIDGFNGHPWLGQGGAAWSKLSTAGVIGDASAYSPHNQWLDILYAGGLLAGVLFVVLIVQVLRSGRGPEAGQAALVLFSAMSVGVFERGWGVVYPDRFFWSLVAVCLAGSLTRPSSRSAFDVDATQVGGLRESVEGVGSDPADPEVDRPTDERDAVGDARHR